MLVRRRKHTPTRSCVVCRETSDKRMLLRVVRQPEKAGGRVVVDPTGKLPGRGAYVCANEKCVGLAQKQKRFERALSVAAAAIDSELFDKLRELALVSGVGDKSSNGAEMNGAPEAL